MATMPPIVRNDGGKDRYQCDGCGWTGRFNSLKDMADFWTRVSAGESVPAGECPKCGALCHPVKKSSKPFKENKKYPLSDWKYEVDNGDTRYGYDDWLKAKLEEEADNG